MCFSIFLYFFIRHFVKPKRLIGVTHLSEYGRRRIKKTIDVLQSITKSKSCQQMLGRLRKSKSLDLSHRDISDIRILIESDLEVLLLRSTFVTDISVLQHQHKLRILDISKTKIDASQVSYIPTENIETLYLGNNNFTRFGFSNTMYSSKTYICKFERFSHRKCRILSEMPTFVFFEFGRK